MGAVPGLSRRNYFLQQDRNVFIRLVVDDVEDVASDRFSDALVHSPLVEPAGTGPK